jgi:type VI secretion system secreted protein VgrG
MAYSQKDRPFRLTTPLGPDVLLLVDWEGEERVSSFYRFTVRAFSERGDISAKDLLLKPVSLELRIEDGTNRKIHGIVSRLSRGGSAPIGYVAYSIEIVPPHWALSLDEGFDIAQNKSVRDMCDTLLTGTPHEWKLTRTLDPRPYIFRYRESRWNCVARLLEQEGIFFRYDHKGSDGKLILGDSTKSAQPAWGVSALKYNEFAMTEPRLTSLTVESQPYVAETRVRTASEFLPTNNVGNATASSGQFSPPGTMKAYRFEQQLTAHRTAITHSGGESSDTSKLQDDTKVYSRLRQERAETMSVKYEGESRYVGLEAGAKTTVEEHPNEAMNQALFVVSVKHRGGNGSYIATDEQDDPYYVNRFEAIPADTPFRPALVAPWPHVGGSHTGVVVGPAGEEIFTDKHGRVQVVFKWDLENSTELDSSCWIRVAQSFAGQQFGMVFIPRIGHEVIVEFLDGNPDNPIVVGSLYNAANLPPYTLPDNKTQSGVKTKSTLKGGADNYNELKFEDKKGSELINVQAEKDLNTLVKNDETRKVGHDRTTEIKNHETKTVKEGNETTTIEKGWQKIEVKDNNRDLMVKKNHTVAVNGNEKITVDQNRDVIVNAKQSHTVASDDTVKIKGKQTTTITDNHTTKIEQGNDTFTADMGNVEVNVKMGNHTTKLDLGKISSEAMQSIELKVGQSSIKVDQMGVTIKGMMIKIEGQMMTQVKGLMTQVEGQAMTTIKGGVTMIN